MCTQTRATTGFPMGTFVWGHWDGRTRGPESESTLAASGFARYQLRGVLNLNILYYTQSSLLVRTTAPLRRNGVGLLNAVTC